MAISRLTGQMLNSTLERDGVPLAFVDTANSAPALYIDVANTFVGVNTAIPNVELDVNGNIFANNLSTTGNISAGNILTPGIVSVVGNIYTSDYFVGNVVGNVSVSGNNTDIVFNKNGNIAASDNLRFDYTSNVLGVTGDVTATGNISGNYFLGNGSQLTGVAATNVNANALVGNVLSANVSISTLTQVGILANLLVSTTISAAGNITGGNVIGGNLLATGIASTTGNIYTPAYFVGNVVGNVSVSGNNTDIVFNKNGNIAASDNLRFDYTSNVLGVTGDVTATGNISGNYFLGNGSQLTGVAATNVNANALVGNILSANVTSSSLTQVGTLANLTVSTTISAGGNISGANILASGLVSASGTITGTSFLGNVVSVTGSVTAASIYGNVINAVTISASGNLSGNYLTVSGGNIVSAANANITLIPNGTGVVSIADVNGGATGIAMGTPTLGNLVSNAVTLYTTTSVTNGIAELNYVLGKLVPPAPPQFPASQYLSINSSSSYRMANNVTQQNNTRTGSKYVPGGTVVSTVLRSGTYGTASIVNVGPGDSGTLATYLNSSVAGNVTFNSGANPTANGVYGNLSVYNNFDYHYANSNIILGFWYVFSTSASGTVTQGWNEVYISDNVASNTNTSVWYYDNSNPGTPQFTSTSLSTPVSPVYSYSSTIPHYVNTNNFTITANVNRLSGNMYPLSDTFVSGASGGAFGAPVSLTYASANIPTPLTQNLYANSGNIQISTTATIISGFGASSGGPTLNIFNSYATGTNTFTPGSTVLYKTGNTTAIDEGNIIIGSTIGSGSGNAIRIVNPGTGNTPVFSGNEPLFNSQTGPLYTYDAIVVGNGSQGLLTFSQTNFASGYVPVGPNLSGQGASQWFTFKFVRSSTSKFNISITGTVGGVWVALPGSVLDSNIGGVGPTSSLNGWLDMSVPYAGSGRPGANSSNGGNGSDGCSLGGAIPLNTSINGGYTCTFGTVSSSSTSSNEIYVRIRLTSGQSISALSLQTASN
jgi:hypothetical protein